MPHQDLVILIPIWALHGPSDSGLQLGIIVTWLLYSTPGPNFDRGPLVSLWTSIETGYSGSPSGPHPYMVNLVPPGLHLDLVNLVHTCSSPGPGDSGQHLGLTWTW